MKRFFLVTGILLIFILTGCALLGSFLPSELLGSWSSDNGYYSRTFTFTVNHMYYEDYADNTGGSAEWDNAIIDVNTEENYFVTSYDCWSWHVSGSTLYLYKEAYAGIPDPSLPDTWWTDNSVGKYTLTKD
ncbi:MAG TPA: hypothetical protein DCO79_04695 [Spirochaeta sp.]|nr:hypothetical protein [Spirochaeta sp.]